MCISFRASTSLYTSELMDPPPSAPDFKPSPKKNAEIAERTTALIKLGFCLVRSLFV